MRRFATVAFLAVLAGTAQAEDWTFDVFLGGAAQGPLSFGTLSRDLDTGPIGGIAINRNAGRLPFEIGIELSHSENAFSDVADETQSATSLMATGRYSLLERGRIDSYAGLGLGLVQVGNDDGTGTATDETVGGQFMLGARYSFPSSTYEAFVEYRYLDTFDDASIGGANVEYNRQDVIMGIRLGF